MVLSEFGGYALAVEGHVSDVKPFGYKKHKSSNELRRGITLLYDGQIRPAVKKGLSAAVYTQLTDVEGELNGLVTYDRRELKVPAESMRSIVKMPALKK